MFGVGKNHGFTPKMGFLISEPHYQKGTGLINEKRYQNGSGLFSFLTKGIKMISPLLSKGANVLKKVANSATGKKLTSKLSDSALNIAADAVADVIEGKNPKEGFNANLNNARNEISETIRSGLKRKNDDQKKNNDPILPQKKKKINKKSKRKNVKFNTIL